MRVKRLTLALCATLAVLLAVEVGFRVQVALEDRGILTPDLVAGIDMPPPDQEVMLGHIVAVSPNPRIIYELKPDLDVLYVGQRMHTNRHGLRGAEQPLARTDNTVRIVGLGDSFMFGLGVGDDETYLALVEKHLQAELPSSDWQVVNTAVPGYNTVMEVETLAVKGLAWGPDLVILDFVGNDLILPNFIRQPRPVLSLRESFLARFVERRLTDWQSRPPLQQIPDFGLFPAPGYGRHEELASDPDLVPPEYRHHVGWASYQAAMEELRGIADERGFAVLVVSLAPNPGDIQLRALEVASGLGFHTRDVGAALRRHMQEAGIDRYLGSELSLNTTDPHPSALGHTVAAEDILNALLEEVLPAMGLAADPP